MSFGDVRCKCGEAVSRLACTVSNAAQPVMIAKNAAGPFSSCDVIFVMRAKRANGIFSCCAVWVVNLRLHRFIQNGNQA